MDIALAVLLVVYLLPFAVAEYYEHPHRYGVLAVNGILGWTGIGWLGALGWALSARPRAPRARPPLHVVGRPAPIVPARGGRRIAVAAGGLAAAAAVAALLVFGPGTRPERVHVSLRAALTADRAELRLGPGAAWPSAGALEPPCRVHVSAQEGAWWRAWPLTGCGGTATERAGWLRADALVVD